MKKLKFKNQTDNYHFDEKQDIKRIIRVTRERDYSLSETDASEAWKKFSEEYYGVGWLILPSKDEELLNNILEVMEPEE